MLDLAVRNMLFRKVRTILTIIGIAAPVMLVVLMVGVTDMMRKDMTAEMSRYAGQVHVRPPKMGKEDRPIASSVLGLSGDQARTILATVKEYEPSRTSPILYLELEPSAYPNGPANLALFGVEPGHEQAVLAGTPVASGEPTLTSPGDAIIGGKLAVRYGAGVGDPITISGHTYRVRGILQKDVQLLDGLVVVSLSDAQAFAGRGDNVSAVMIGFKDFGRIPAAKQALQAAFPTLDVVTEEDLIANTERVLKQQAKMFDMIIYSAAGSGVVIILLVMYTAVMERTKEIGTLRALGVPRWQVLWALVLESLILGFIGGVIGSLSVGPVLVLGDMTPNGVWRQYQVFFPSMMVSLGVALLIGLVAAAYPAWRASRVDPIESLRYE